MTVQHIGNRSIGADTQQFTSKASYDAWFATQNWNNFVLDKDQKYEVLHLGGEEFVALSKFDTLPVVGFFVKNDIANKIINKAKEQGVEISRIRFWANTAGWWEDKYRLEITGHKGGTGIGQILEIAVIVAIIAVLAIAVIMAIAVYKAITGITASISKYLPWIIGGTVVVLVAMFAFRKPRQEYQEPKEPPRQGQTTYIVK